MKIKGIKYLIIRRIVQLLVLGLFVFSNYYNMKIISGNLSLAKILDTFYLADPYAVLQILFTGYLLNFQIILGAIIVLFIYGLLVGRSFCSWICPVNIITETAFAFRKKYMSKTENILKIPRNIRYWIISLSLILSIITGIAVFEAINPVSMFNRGIIYGIGLNYLVLAGIFLFDLLVLKFGWCGYLCPLGGFYSLAGRYSMLKIHHNVNNCTKCMECIKICPEPQVLTIIGKNSGSIVSGECNNCARCIEKCNYNSLNFKIKLKHIKHEEN